jgi:Ulp1 family protease
LYGGTDTRQVPSQPNVSDCGLFLIHYARQLLERPDEMLAFIQVSTGLSVPR